MCYLEHTTIYTDFTHTHKRTNKHTFTWVKHRIFIHYSQRKFRACNIRENTNEWIAPRRQLVFAEFAHAKLINYCSVHVFDCIHKLWAICARFTCVTITIYGATMCKCVSSWGMGFQSHVMTERHLICRSSYIPNAEQYATHNFTTETNTYRRENFSDNTLLSEMLQSKEYTGESLALIRHGATTEHRRL